jgi:hypothetical protein
VSLPASERILSAAAIMPVILPPVLASMKGYIPLKNRSPIWITLAFSK